MAEQLQRVLEHRLDLLVAIDFKRLVDAVEADGDLELVVLAAALSVIFIHGFFKAPSY